MSESVSQKLKTWIMDLLARFLPDCKSMTPLIGESLDRKLTIREKIVMKLHLITCQACANYLSNLKFMREVFQLQEKRRDENLAVSLSADAKERIKKALISSNSQT
jgi:hypothetical protein